MTPLTPDGPPRCVMGACYGVRPEDRYLDAILALTDDWTAALRRLLVPCAVFVEGEEPDASNCMQTLRVLARVFLPEAVAKAALARHFQESRIGFRLTVRGRPLVVLAPSFFHNRTLQLLQRQVYNMPLGSVEQEEALFKAVIHSAPPGYSEWLGWVVNSLSATSLSDDAIVGRAFEEVHYDFGAVTWQELWEATCANLATLSGQVRYLYFMSLHSSGADPCHGEELEHAWLVEQYASDRYPDGVAYNIYQSFRGCYTLRQSLPFSVHLSHSDYAAYMTHLRTALARYGVSDEGRRQAWRRCFGDAVAIEYYPWAYRPGAAWLSATALRWSCLPVVGQG